MEPLSRWIQVQTVHWIIFQIHCNYFDLVNNSITDPITDPDITRLSGSLRAAGGSQGSVSPDHCDGSRSGSDLREHAHGGRWHCLSFFENSFFKNRIFIVWATSFRTPVHFLSHLRVYFLKDCFYSFVFIISFLFTLIFCLGNRFCRFHSGESSGIEVLRPLLAAPRSSLQAAALRLGSARREERVGGGWRLQESGTRP